MKLQDLDSQMPYHTQLTTDLEHGFYYRESKMDSTRHSELKLMTKFCCYNIRHITSILLTCSIKARVSEKFLKCGLRKAAAEIRQTLGMLSKRMKRLIYTLCTYIPFLLTETKCLENIS